MLKILKQVFLPRSRKPSAQSLNTAVFNEIVSCFVDNIAMLSIGKRMLYPTSFNILLHPDDYHAVEQSLPFIVNEVTNSFYDKIRERNKQYQNSDPPSTYWFFQFSPCAELVFPASTIKRNDIKDTIIETGQPFIMCSLYSTEIGRGNTESVANVKMSLKPKNSATFETVDINPAALRGIDILGKGIFKIPISMDFQPDTKLPASQGNVYAQIKFTDQDGSKVYSMVDKEIIITQKNGASKAQTHFLYINHPALQPSHARIRYVPGNGSFLIAAFEGVKLNGAVLPVSPNNDPQWVLLPNDSKIMITKPNQLPVQLDFAVPR
jgi:hypothetical protein